MGFQRFTQLLRVFVLFVKFKQSCRRAWLSQSLWSGLVNHSILNLYYSGMAYLPALISRCDSPAIRFIAASSQGVLLLMYGAKRWLIMSGYLGSVCLTLLQYYEVDNMENEWAQTFHLESISS